MATSSTELLQTEGTVMLHILFSIKQDQDIGKELLEAVKVCTRQSVFQGVSLYACPPVRMSFCHCMGVTVYTSVTLYSYHTVCKCHCMHVTLCVCLLYVTLHAVRVFVGARWRCSGKLVCGLESRTGEPLCV